MGTAPDFASFPGLDILEIGQNFSFHLVIRGQSRSLQVQMILQLVGTHLLQTTPADVFFKWFLPPVFILSFQVLPTLKPFSKLIKTGIDLDAEPFSTRLN